MKKQRVYNDVAATSQMKMKIAYKYIQKIAPYQLTIEAINLQNKEIYALQQRYLQLLSQTRTAKSQQTYTQAQKQILASREQTKIQQRKSFVQQGLKANSSRYNEEFQRQRKSYLQVLENKRDMLRDMKGNEMNLFFNLEEGVLDQLVEYAGKEQEIDEEERVKAVEEIRWWKKRYEISQRKEDQLELYNK